MKETDIRPYYPLLLILALLVPYTFLFYDFSLPPFEDAAILMRYADHLAAGEGVVYNPGGAPVDGATDFLFMAVSAGLMKLGLSVEGAIRLLSVLSHFLIVILVYHFNLRFHGVKQLWAGAAAAFVAIGPGISYVESHFGTSFFALFALLTWMQAWKIMRGDASMKRALLFSGLALATGLIRPEGVFLTGFMLLAVVLHLGIKRDGGAFKAILAFVGVFGILGGAYFYWHYKYFGYPLPNPFYIKGGGTLHFYSLKKSVLNTLQMTLPFLPVLWLGLVSKASRKLSLFVLTPFVLFTGLWILMSDAMNYNMRFQYVMVPMFLISFAPFLKGAKLGFLEGPSLGGLLPGPRVRMALVASMLGFVLLYQHLLYGAPVRRYPDGRYDMGVLLSKWKAKGYTMAISEAGNLPHYSGWKAIDAWGLNNIELAHGADLLEMLQDKQPELMMVHDYNLPFMPRRVLDPHWTAMCDAIHYHGDYGGYITAAIYGIHPYKIAYYYVKADCPDSEEIVKAIREMQYIWYETGEESIDYAAFEVLR